MSPVTFDVPPGFEHREKKCFTLAFIGKEDKILLGLKKRGLGEGLWNGFGGKVMPGEDIVEAAMREIQEECGLTVKTQDLEQFAVILFEFQNEPVLFEMHVFKTNKFSGEVIESDEMKPAWYSKDKTPPNMWPDNEVWYPLYILGKKFNAYFLFEGYTKILSYYIRDCENNNEILKSIIQPQG